MRNLTHSIKVSFREEGRREGGRAGARRGLGRRCSGKQEECRNLKEKEDRMQESPAQKRMRRELRRCKMKIG